MRNRRDKDYQILRQGQAVVTTKLAQISHSACFAPRSCNSERSTAVLEGQQAASYFAFESARRWWIQRELYRSLGERVSHSTAQRPNLPAEEFEELELLGFHLCVYLMVVVPFSAFPAFM